MKFLFVVLCLVIVLLEVFIVYGLNGLYDICSRSTKGRIKRLKSESKFISHQLCRIIDKQCKIKRKIKKLENYYDKLQIRFLRKHVEMVKRDDEIIKLQKD